MLGLPGFDFESSQDVLVAARGAQDARQAFVQGAVLDNTTSAVIDLSSATGRPVSASIYQLDGIVRRAPSLQLTADARAGAVAAQAQGVTA
jgi:NADH-quinone oxidoreductase subunit G